MSITKAELRTDSHSIRAQVLPRTPYLTPTQRIFMLTITLQGDDAQEYLNYLNRSTSLPTHAPVAAIEPAQSIATPTRNSSIDAMWKTAVNTNHVPEQRNGKMWSETERAILINAIDKHDKFYYSLTTLAKYLGRSRNAILSEAHRQQAQVVNGFLISTLKDKPPHGHQITNLRS